MAPPLDGDLTDLINLWYSLANVTTTELILVIINLGPVYGKFIATYYYPYMASSSQAIELSNSISGGTSSAVSDSNFINANYMINIINEINIHIEILLDTLSDVILLNNIPAYNTNDYTELAIIRNIHNTIITINNNINTLIAPINYKNLSEQGKSYFSFLYTFLFGVGHILGGILYQVKNIILPAGNQDPLKVPNIKNRINNTSGTQISPLNKLINYYNTYKYYIYIVILLIIILLIILIF